MGKFIIECPHCGTYQEASTGFFSRKVLECKCGKIIDVNKDKTTIKECPHCGNTVLYDQAKGDNALCPICKNHLVTEESKSNYAIINCPSCYCELQVDKNAKTYTCPLCKEQIDVQSVIVKEEMKSKGLASIIKYEGPNNVLVWKHPIEDFNLGSQLIVHESQEAIFFRDGKALDSFGAGRYTLATEKLPILKDLYKLPFDSNKAFHSEVYFINMVTQTGIKWGTDTKVRMFDPASGLSLEIGAYGEFNIKVSNARKLLIKLIGTTSELKNIDIIDSPYDIKVVSGKFKALIISKVKLILAKHIKNNNINILEVDEHMDELSKSMKEEINKTLEDYGMFLPEFYVLKILTPDEDPNFRRMKEQYAEQYLLVREEQIKKNVAIAEQQRRVVEAQTGAQEEIIAAQAQAEAYRLKAQAEAQEMQMKGYTYQDETKRQVGLAAMENMPQGGPSGAATGVIGDMVGLGVTMGAVGSVMSMAKEVITPVVDSANKVGTSITKQNSTGWNCVCGQTNITSTFCPSCGSRKPEINNWECPKCHTSNINSLFCPNCGTKKPEEKNGWTCSSCGKTNIKSGFCPDCGMKKTEENMTWDCECGEKNISSNYCPSCGKKKGE